MGNNKYFFSGGKSLTVLQQGIQLKKIFPDSRVSYNRNSLTWLGNLQPSPLSNIYTVRIIYRLKKSPEVEIIEPQLENKNLPHVFEGNRLCLFRNKKHYEWDPTMPLTDTIVPWTSLWLLYYEIWLVTEKWCGSKQEHPNHNKKKNINE
jgi:hypothetical protein